MKFCCASNGARKNFKIARKKIQENHNFPKNYRFFENTTYIFGFLEVLPVISTTYLSV